MPKLLRFIFMATTAISSILLILSCSDKNLTNVEKYLRSDSKIQSRLGEIKSLSRTNTIVVRAGDKTKAYREYQFIVRGSRGKALVNIKVENMENSPNQNYLIRSIDDL
jgi:hypothetical protein